MPLKAVIHRPPGWQQAKRERRDALDRAYGTQAWRKLAAAVIVRDQGICHLCGEPGAEGPTSDPAVAELRQRQMRNFLAALMLSQARAGSWSLGFWF